MRRNTTGGIVAVFVVGLVLIRFPRESVQAGESSGRAALGYMAQGAAANREAFTQFRCKFRLTRGKAATFQDALDGKLTEPIRWEGIWIVDGEKVRHELICDPAYVEAALAKERDAEKKREEARKREEASGSQAKPSGPPAGKGFATAGVPSNVPSNIEAHLKYGEHTLTYGFGPTVGTASLIEDASQLIGRVTPFAMNVMGPNELFSPATLLRTSLEGKGTYTARYDGTEKVRGVETMVATVTYVEGGYWKLYLDPRRGFLPVRFLAMGGRDNKVYQQAETLEMCGCSGGRWYPVRSVVVFDPEGPPPFRIEVYDTLEFDVDRAPTDDEFHLDLAAKTGVNMRRTQKGPWHFKLTSPERIHGKDLPQVYQRILDSGEKELAERGRMEGPQPTASTPSRGRLIFTIGCLIVIVGLVIGLVVWRIGGKPSSRT